MFIDSHAHIDFYKYDDDRDEMIKRALDAGIDIIVAIGNGDVVKDSHEKAQALADKYPFIYTTVGLHPHDASLLDEVLETKLTKLSKHPKVIGWGEIGLDYYYNHSPHQVQQEAFIKQLALARERRLPIIIHTRDAEEDTKRILKEHWLDTGLAGIFHCFTSSYDLAKAALEMGFLISFSGVITFKKSKELRETAARLPLERLLIETDCPYLAPEPFRGKRNEPAWVIETAKQLAELHNTTTEKVAEITSNNFRKFFNLG
ncbi:MAG: TatD family hydrolase [Acidobacteria bacterium]|nr:TatD family hydrolase [Acidobacteriota bacterium]